MAAQTALHFKLSLEFGMSAIVRYSIGNRPAALLVGVLVLTHLTGLKAEICKWMDENGGVHFAETCPEGVQATHVELQPPPSRSQVEDASSRYVNAQPQSSGQEEDPAGIDTSLTVGTDQLREHCLKAKLSLDKLSSEYPVYYDQAGALRTDRHKSVLLEFDHSGRYLDAGRRGEQVDYWKKVERNNCTPEILDSGIRQEIKQIQKKQQKKDCGWWRSELEYMERNKSFHKERLDLKKLFNANCK